jgi:hypothetical protein
MRKATLLLFTTTILLLMAGCSAALLFTSNTPTAPSGDTAPVGLTVTDTPPAGVVVLFFQLSVTGVSLEPGNVSLLSSANPVPVNVSQLQAESAFVGSANMAPGTYTSLNLTFSNPQLTIYNSTGSAIGTCANNTICQLTPAATPLTLTFSSSPFPITLTANSPLGLALDIHLNTVIQPDLTVNLAATNGVTLSQLPAPATGHPTSVLGQLMGTVQSLGRNRFSLQTSYGGTYTVDVNSSTTYDIPPTALCGSVCEIACQGLGCLIVGDVVKVEAGLQPDGTLLASEVDYVESAGQQAVEGTIVGVTPSEEGTSIDLILQVVPPTSTPSLLAPGQHASVLVPMSSVTYAVDWGNFTPPSNYNLGPFAGAGGLLVGQEISVVVQGSVSTSGSGSSGTPPLTPVGPAPISFTINSITLEPTQITGQISNIDASAMDFAPSTFPSFFIPAESPWGTRTLSSAWITVDTTAQTTYDGLSPDNFSGLAVNDLVSVEGWLLPYSGPIPLVACSKPCPVPTTMAAKAVRGRPNQLF